jgi:hypothetical protein
VVLPYERGVRLVIGSEGHRYLGSGLTHKCEVDARMSEECEIHESLMSRRVGNPMFQIPETSGISEYLGT